MTGRVVAIDVSCECGATLIGAWSGAEADAWAESHDHDDNENDEKERYPALEGGVPDGDV